MAKNPLNFTKETLDKIVPNSSVTVYNDTKEKGLILMVSCKGTKTFYLSKKIKGKSVRKLIGRFPELSVHEARERAIELKSQIAKGLHTTEVIVEDNEMTFGQLHDKFIDHAKNKNTTWERDAKLIKKKAEHFYDKKLSTIQRDDIQKSFNNCINPQATNPLRTGRILANRCLSNIRTVFNKGIAWGWKGKNPTYNIEKNPEKARERYLCSEEEYKRFSDAIETENNPTMRDAILMLLYTAARKNNVLSMEWNGMKSI